uniref:Uncharacterized protein n=1 Tax=Parastrongyloides trichosuri TaxID=131310 RepID=A0A0N4ZKR2_PARTI
MLFAEKEPGKPLRGGFTFAVLFGIIILNLIIFVIVRFLLDIENDMDQPYIDGPLRIFLQYFLLYFSLSFCFGCWCCCCGGGYFCIVFKKIKFCRVRQKEALDFAAMHKLYNRIKHVKPNTTLVKKFKRKKEDESNSEDDNDDKQNGNSFILQEVIVDTRRENDKSYKNKKN